MSKKRKNHNGELQQRFSVHLRETRLARALTQEDVAEVIGVSLEFYGRMERGVAMPSWWMLYRLMRSLNVSGDFLLGRQKSETAPLLFPDSVQRSQ